MMQDAPDDHNNYTVGFCIVKRIAVSQLLISAYDAPYMRRTNHTGAATRLGTCMSANNDVLGTAIE